MHKKEDEHHRINKKEKDRLHKMNIKMRMDSTRWIIKRMDSTNNKRMDSTGCIIRRMYLIRWIIKRTVFSGWIIQRIDTTGWNIKRIDFTGWIINRVEIHRMNNKEDRFHRMNNKEDGFLPPFLWDIETYTSEDWPYRRNKKVEWQYL